MTFLTNLGAFTDVATRVPDDATQQGLELAETTIASVIKTIEDEQALLDPADFENSGHISAGSFGGADRAPALALHHTRAHAVTAATLKGVLEDLRTFQQACRDAQKAIVGADEDAADRLRLTQVAVDSLTIGSQTDHGESSNRQAQRDHQDDTVTDEPPAEDD